jgi:hypothetical protein
VVSRYIDCRPLWYGFRYDILWLNFIQDMYKVVFLVAIVEILQQTKYVTEAPCTVWVRVKADKMVWADIVARIHHVSCLIYWAKSLFDHNIINRD